MSKGFRFQASAIGAAGHITVPFREQIQVQASCALPEIGGYGSAISRDFRYREILKFEVAHSEVTGSEFQEEDGAVFATLATSTVEGLNVMDMVTADRVVAHVVSSFRAADGKRLFHLIGTRFENLKIAGIPVSVNLALDVKNEDFPAEGRNRREIARGSLLRRVESELSRFEGHVIHIDGFGTIRLAELDISPFTRRVTMLEVDLGCPVQGRVMACSIIGDGSDF